MTNNKTPLTAAEIAELRRKEAATKGPWEYIEEKQVVSKKFNLLYATVRNPDRNLLRFNADKDGIAHAELIVALRNFAPRLLAAAEREWRMREALEAARPYIGHHEKCPGWGNDRGASCNCGGQDGYAIIDAALAETEVQK